MSPEGVQRTFRCWLSNQTLMRHHMSARRLMPFESYNPYMTLQSYIPFMPLKTYAAQHETPVAPDPRAAAQSPALIPQGARAHPGCARCVDGPRPDSHRQDRACPQAPERRATAPAARGMAGT